MAVTAAVPSTQMTDELSPVCLTELHLNPSQPQNCSGNLMELLWLHVQMLINRFSAAWGFQCLVLQTGRDLGNAGVPEHQGLKWTCSTRKLSQSKASHPQETLRCKLTWYLSLSHNTQATAWHSISTGGLKAPSLKRISATKPFADCFSNSPLSITWRDFRLEASKAAPDLQWWK